MTSNGLMFQTAISCRSLH